MADIFGHALGFLALVGAIWATYDTCYTSYLRRNRRR